MAEKMLKEDELNYCKSDTKCLAHFFIGIALYLSECVSYSIVKHHLKEAICLANNDQMKSAISHNLAVLNYCEMLDHNDRIYNGKAEGDEEQFVEEMEKFEEQKH